MLPPRPPLRLSGAPELTTYLAQLDAWMHGVENKLNLAYGLSSFLTGSPAGPQSSLSVPHNDSFLYADDVDNLHPANLRYVMPANVQRLASARLSIHLAPYRTYNTITGTNTGNTSNNHNHAHNHGAHSHNHAHTIPIGNAGGSSAIQWSGSGNALQSSPGISGNTSPINSDATAATPGIDSTGQSADHTHPLNLSQTLGVTEGTTAAGVMISFDGVDVTAALGGPFSADVIELDVTKYLPQAKGVWHTIALTPAGIGRIEAHLRLAVFVNAAAAI